MPFDAPAKGTHDGRLWPNSPVIAIGPARHPYKYEVNRSPEGSGRIVDTNIIKAGDWYY